MRLATWNHQSPAEYLGFRTYNTYNDSSTHMWLNFRHENMDYIADVVRDFGVYIWLGNDKSICFTSKFHDVHSADLPQLQSMMRFLKKNQINTPFYKLEGREHLRFLLKEILTILKVTEQTNYPSDTITSVDYSKLVNAVYTQAKNTGWEWE